VLSTYINTHFFKEKKGEGSKEEQRGVGDERERPQCLRLEVLFESETTGPRRSDLARVQL